MQLYVDEGYAYVAMDVPGTGRSAGVWDFVSRAEGEAIHDIIEHVAGQHWSSGAVGMIGMSYYCWSQWNAARTRPPSLMCLGAYDGATDMNRDWMYHGGMPVEMFLDAWLFGAVLTQHLWEGHDVRGGGRAELVCDILSHSPPDSFAGAQQQYADPEFHRAELLPWYDHHLKGVENGVMDRPPVRVFVQGEQKYGEAAAWPPGDAAIAEFFLSGERSGVVRSLNDGSLVDDPPSATEDSTSWSYPDSQWMVGVTTFDEKGIPDHVARVNTFTSRPFERDREFTGRGVLVLHASSDQTDMDVIAKLTLLSGEGEAIKPIKVSQGWLRASHRAEDAELTEDMRPFHSHAAVDPIAPGDIYELRLSWSPCPFSCARASASGWRSATRIR
jgi:predicted acyl esterase